MSAEAEMNLLMLKGVVSDLPEEEQKQIKDMVEQLNSVLDGKDDELGLLAMGLFAAEIALKM